MVVDGLIPTSIAAMGNMRLGTIRSGIVRIIGALNPIGVGAALRKSDYNKLWQSGRSPK